MAQCIDAHTLRSWLHDKDEIAVLDVRDGGPYSRSHILVASSAPLAQFETTVPSLVPRTSTRIVLVDDGNGESEYGAQLLETAGYSVVYILDGGNSAWESAGFMLFSGSGIISKAFGELVEHTLHTPPLEAETLAQWQRENMPFLLFDSRPLAEYRTVSLPGATDCPGAELLYRVPQTIPNSDIPIVVNCAGRTRSIIGAQSLREAGITNPIYALKNGTMGWQISGLETVHGASNVVPEPTENGLRIAQSFAAEVLARDNTPVITKSQLDAMMSDTSRTTYVFDVRQADAFERGHIPGSTNAAGGQLVQATDTYAAVRNARIVLVDEHMVQSVMTAHWLSRMGWQVSILKDARHHMTEKEVSSPVSLTQVSSSVSEIEVSDLSQKLQEVSVIDVGESYWYRQGRIPGSWYSMRSRLRESLTRFDSSTPIVFCCTNGSIAPFAAHDAHNWGYTNVSYLVGGRNAWKRAGLSVEVIGDEDDERIVTPTDDMWYPPWARKEGVTEAMMQYLTWEVGLLDTVSKETYINFSL